MRHSASLDADGVPRMTLADGRTARVGTPEIQALVSDVAGSDWAFAPARRDVLKTIGKLNKVNAGIYADVVRPEP